VVYCLLMEGLVAVILGVSPLKTAVPAPSPTSPQAMKQWLSGQEAMRGGRPRQAITAYQKALEVDPTLARAHLSLAAAHLDLQEDHLAADHLRRYLSHQPEHVQVRQHLADLLFRLGQHALAEAEYRQTLSDVSPDPTGILSRIHCHGKLMELATILGNTGAIHLHRGIGLFLLAGQAGLVEPSQRVNPEALLCRAAGELLVAQKEDPDSSLPAWYLHQVWHLLGQNHLARLWLDRVLDDPMLKDLDACERILLANARQEQACQARMFLR